MKKKNSASRPGKPSHLLLAGAFAGMVLPQSSDAQVANEPPDYGNDFSTRSNLGSGITIINGSLTLTSDVSDYFQISGLTGGSSFSIDVSANRTSGTGAFINLSILDSSGGQIDLTSSNLASSPTFSDTLTGIVPNDGILVGAAEYNEGIGSASYVFAVPEPRASVLTAAAALAALAARRRKKSEKSE